MPRRLINLVGFLASAGLLGYAYYAQYVLHLDPCPLCWFQRAGVALLGLIFLVATLHNPKGWGARVYAVLLGAAALLTIGVAGRHIYVQHMPPGSLPSCGAPLEYLIKITPFSRLGKLFASVLAGSGECSAIPWRFLTLSMPEWVLLCAVVLGAWGVIGNLQGATQPREDPLAPGASGGQHA